MIGKPGAVQRVVDRHRDARYPALELWWSRVGDTPPSWWTRDALWRAACCEAEAAEYAKDHPKRERESQRQAIATMLGVPPKDGKLDLEWQRQYLAAIEKASR